MTVFRRHCRPASEPNEAFSRCPFIMSSKKISNKKGSSLKNEASLERKPELGMNPVAILAGYGPRGERIRHTVHNGALTLPIDALAVLEDAVQETGLTPPEKFSLPGLDTVVRPTMDPTLKSVIVTHLGLQRVLVPDPSYQPMQVPPGYPQPQQNMIEVVRTVIENRTMKRTRDIEPPVDRIRGGGENEDMDIDPVEMVAPSVEAGHAAPAAPPMAALPSTPAPVQDGMAPSAEMEDSTEVQNAVPPVPAPSSATPSSPPAGPAYSAEPNDEPKASIEPSTLASGSSYSTEQPRPSHPVSEVSKQAVAASEQSLQAIIPSSQSVVPPTQLTAPTPAPISVPAPAPAIPVPQSATSSATATYEKVASSATATNEKVATSTPAPPQAKLLTLDIKPEPRWEQHRPGPNDEMVAPEDQLTPKPSWYAKDGVADIERAMLPEWFNQSAPHRTPESYIKAREIVIEMSTTLANRHVTNAMVRRSVVGDAGSLLRLRNFLTNWGLINEDSINDSAPTAAILREKYPVPKQLNERQCHDLVAAVVEQNAKRRKLDSDSSFLPINWEEIAQQVGEGASPDDCERHFLSVSIPVDEAERPITPEASSPRAGSRDAMRQEIIRELVESCKPEVVRKATAAALEAADLKEAQAGAVVGLMSVQVLETARQAEQQVESVLSQLLDQRMKKLENRMAMMDDIEAILEAEKMALELERRDLYTARCRHWFGGA
jgi:SWIRM domain/SWIRM-associated region 1